MFLKLIRLKKLLRKLRLPFLLGGEPPSCDLLDSYSETNKSTDNELSEVHPALNDISAVGQSFEMGASNKKICKAKFYLKKYGSPVGNLKALLYASTGTHEDEDVKPTGSALASSDSVSMESVGTDFELVEFTFTGEEKYEMQANTIYCIEVVAYDATTLDIDNSVLVGIDGSLPTHDGNESFYEAEEWIADGSSDVCFYIYGEEV